MEVSSSYTHTPFPPLNFTMVSGVGACDPTPKTGLLFCDFGPGIRESGESEAEMGQEYPDYG